MEGERNGLSRESTLVIYSGTSLMRPCIDLLAVVGHSSVINREIWQIFTGRFVLVDLLAAEVCLRTEDHVSVLRPFQAQFYLEIIEELPFTVDFAVLTRSVRDKVLGLATQPPHVLSCVESLKHLVTCRWAFELFPFVRSIFEGACGASRTVLAVVVCVVNRREDVCRVPMVVLVEHSAFHLALDHVSVS